jgi:hypothetical protein
VQLQVYAPTLETQDVLLFNSAGVRSMVLKRFQPMVRKDEGCTWLRSPLLEINAKEVRGGSEG